MISIAPIVHLCTFFTYQGPGEVQPTPPIDPSRATVHRLVRPAVPNAGTIVVRLDPNPAGEKP